ncbi:class I SAM-dependent methyltransferase [Pseudoflavitalea sp. X16]|uniref:class I SAM-dependent methyltransferase n=1 Tax=Paraflavitalea devenefica TaxID=2716334 RepID=UPI0014204A6A|nr:class I SAM-dependent methyltransferase [Paraflavitalea devenefica]NII28255.1 class I SAM-dependent methyltransferase [Paraflavitalea devenefica]
MEKSAIIHHTHCPGCNATAIHQVLAVKDYTVSQQSFEVWHCDACTLRFTQDVPAEDAIGQYYQSENYISHTNTSKGLVNRLYHIVRNYTLGSKKRLVQAFTQKTTGTLLDVGAGVGAFAGFMRQQGWQVTGLEPDAETRKRALEQHRITLQDTSDLFKLPAGHFDAITLWHVLEHVHRLHACLDQLKTLLKPGGVLLVAVPNYTAADATFYASHWAAYDVPRHLYHFSPASMRVLLQQHGLTVKAIKPMWFDSFYVSLLSEKYKTGKASVVKGFFRGFVSNGKALRNKEQCSSLIYVITK